MKMKRLTRWAAALGMTALLLCGSAFAAGEQTIAVQLNGEDLTFTDAVPQVKDQRTFLPFRAVFEAMGAEVSNEGNVITAKQGDKTLTMTIGETAATVTQLGMEVPITMDVAPYVDNTTWRTYVPVRFAAQAFGYTVGWDQDSYTAILIDPVKVMNEAMEGKEFTYLEKLAEYSEKYNKGIWDMTMDMDGSLTMLGGTMPMSATAKGTTQDEMKMSMDMNMKMDLTEYIKSVSLLMGEEEATLDAEAQAQLDALAQEGIDLSMRGNMDEGKLYMMMGGSLLESAGIPKDTWFLMDFDAIFAQTGLNADWKQLMTAARSADMTPMLAALLAAGQQPATASTAYGEMKAQMEKLVALFADDAFVKDGNNYTATIDFLQLTGQEAEGTEGTLTLTLTMRRNEAVGYAMGIHAASTNEELGVMAVDITMALDDKDQMKANIAMDMGELLNINLDLNAKYTKGRTAPETVPPAGAVVLPLDQMMGSSMGVIGGADGPTTIIVGE